MLIWPILVVMESTWAEVELISTDNATIKNVIRDNIEL